MQTSLRAALSLLGVALVVGCSSSSSSPNGSNNDGGTSGGSDFTNAAHAAAKAMCDRTAACAPAVITGVYGDVDACAARLAAGFVPGLGATGSTVSAANMNACAQAAPSISCSDLLSNALPAACKAPAGTLADGAACALDAQCAAAHCKRALGQPCGTCAARAQTGGSCAVATDCVDANTCANGTCVKLGAAGDACSSSAPCRGDLECRSGKCSSPAAVGDACSESDGCDETHGIVCSAASKKCVKITYAYANGACGLVPSGLELCAASGFCKGVQAPTYQGTCVAAPADGEPCPNGVCQAGSVCTGGRCALVEPSKCP